MSHRCYLIEVNSGTERLPNAHFFEFYARVNKDGNVSRPTETRGPHLFASREEVEKTIDRIKKYKAAEATFQGREIPPGVLTPLTWKYRAVPVLVPVRTVVVRASFEIPIEGVGPDPR